MKSADTIPNASRRARRKPRLFWIMLMAFLLVILLGICGMLGLIGLTVTGIWRPSQQYIELQDDQFAWTQLLADYYSAHGESWKGVDRRLMQFPAGRPLVFTSYVLVDERGRVIASNMRLTHTGQLVEEELLLAGSPIVVDKRRVGTFILRPGLGPFPHSELTDPPRPPSVSPAGLIWPVLRSFLLAGVGLALMLLLMAVIFVRRIVRPLRSLTAATQALAAGQLSIQVPGASVHELDELARSFNAMAQALARADAQRRQMTADIAHELRTPLTIIKGRLEGLQDGVYDATPEQIALLLHESALLERLIEDLRLLALAETGQLPLFRDALDPLDLLQGVKASFAGQAATHQVELLVEAPDELPQILVDPQRILQVLANLVTNALRYTPEGGRITLRATCSSDAQNPAVVLQVADTGPGIAVEDLPHIFDRFWRVDRARARGSGGAGLGLAIARQIVAAHGGTIWAESRLGVGTTISIQLPIGEQGLGEGVKG